jgi:hypothetical protein
LKFCWNGDPTGGERRSFTSPKKSSQACALAAPPPMKLIAGRLAAPNLTSLHESYSAPANWSLTHRSTDATAVALLSAARWTAVTLANVDWSGEHVSAHQKCTKLCWHAGQPTMKGSARCVCDVVFLGWVGG